MTIYQTEIPYNTQLYRDLKAGSLPALPVSWEAQRARLAYAFAELERAGYTVASASHSVKDPQRHRFVYHHCLWQVADMLGLGVGAFGYFGGVHYQNAVTLEGPPLLRSTIPPRSLHLTVQPSEHPCDAVPK